MAAPEKSKPARQRMQFPWWWNAVMGVAFLAAGIYFYAHATKGESNELRLIFLGLYVLFAALFVGRAVRQWQVRRG